MRGTNNGGERLSNHSPPMSRPCGQVASRLAASFLAVLVLLGSSPGTVFAATPTTTTLDVASDTVVIPFGDEFGSVWATAHVLPPPQPDGGFTPAVSFLVDGVLQGVGPIDANGDAVGTIDFMTVGSHSIVASFGGLGDFEASQSDPATVVVKLGTMVELSSSLNPALNTQSVTITATVSPASVTGGTLSIVDALDGSTIASGAVGSGATSVTVTRTFATGSHPLTATYTGDGDFEGSQAHVTQTVNADTMVNASGLNVAYPTFYPYRDDYRDTELVRGNLHETATVAVRIFNPSGSLIKNVSLGTLSPGAYVYAWNGRNSSGAILPEGRYKIVQRLRDSASNVKTATFYVVLSRERLIWRTSTIRLDGSQIFGYADPGNGSINTTASAYGNGVLLSSGGSWVGVVYRFTLRSAVRYGKTITFAVRGRSPNNRTVSEGLWNRDGGAWSNPNAYDYKTIGPGYQWWSISGSSRLHLSAQHRAFGSVVVANTGAVRTFDIESVRLVYRWAVLGYA